MSEHARLSPSGAERWMACPGSIYLEAAFPDEGSSYAKEGTLAHELAAGHLKDGWKLEEYIGESWTFEDGTVLKITADMVDHVHKYTDYVKAAAEGATLLVEQRVDFSHVVDVPKSFGTADAIIVGAGGKLTVVDLKFGMGVRVDAEDNAQLQIYALGALAVAEMIDEISEVTVVAHMPRLDHVTEWTIPVAQLRAFGDTVHEAAARVMAIELVGLDEETDLMAGPKQCRFCRAKSTCPELLAEMTDVVGMGRGATMEDFAEFVVEVPDMTIGDNYLAVAMAKVALVEDWCKSVRAEMERRLLAGRDVPGFKLVEGKLGNRAWIDAAEAEVYMKNTLRLKQDEMYDRSVISPTTAEKRLKKAAPAKWDKLQSRIHRAPGKPSVAPVDDPRPALTVANTADDLRAMTTAN